jgi:hypothetical protein
MSGKQRGPAPEDAVSFGALQLPTLRTAVDELSWLLGRGYPERTALVLVGDRHALTARQRKAVSRCAAPPSAVSSRRSRCIGPAELAGQVVHVDGLNAIIVGESLWSGGVVLRGRDGVHRDLASVHGTYAHVNATDAVIDALAELLAPAREVVWLLDRPVSNSGRLAGRLRARAEAAGLPWQVELVWDPDRVLVSSEAIVATGDARILDANVRWIDLPGVLVELVARAGVRAWVIDLASSPG